MRSTSTRTHRSIAHTPTTPPADDNHGWRKGLTLEHRERLFRAFMDARTLEQVKEIQEECGRLALDGEKMVHLEVELPADVARLFRRRRRRKSA